MLSLNADPEQLDELVRLYRELGRTPGYSAGITNTTDDIKIINFFSGLNTCGGKKELDLPYVCETHIYDHKYCTVQAKFMTDGTPASIAANRVDRLDDGVPADLNRLAYAYKSIMNGSISSYSLSFTFPGSLR